MKSMLRFILLISWVILSGCTSSQTTQKDDNMSTRNFAIPEYQVCKTGQYPHDDGRYLNAPKTVLIFYSDNSEDINAFEKEYCLLTGEQAPLFEGTMIIAKMGTKSTGGYSYEVHHIVEYEDFIEVKLNMKQPGTEDAVTLALTNPYIIMLLPENHKEVKVTE